MIKDYELSKKLLDNASKAKRLVHESLFWVKDTCSQPEFQEYRRSVAYVLSEIYDRIEKPISDVHSKLDPLKENQAEDKKHSLEKIAFSHMIKMPLQCLNVCITSI